VKGSKFSLSVALSTFVLTALAVFAYARAMWGLSPRRALRFLTAEGNFPQTVAVSALAGYLIYKYFDHRDDLARARGALGGMIAWFLVLLALKWGF